MTDYICSAKADYHLLRAYGSASRFSPRSVLLSIRSEVATGNPHPQGDAFICLLLKEKANNPFKFYGDAVPNNYNRFATAKCVMILYCGNIECFLTEQYLPVPLAFYNRKWYN